MMKYKVGDKVKIRKDLEVGQAYGSCLFKREMKNLCGEIARIIEVHEHYGDYCVASSSFYWTDEMFEDDDTEVPKMNKCVVIDVDGNKVVARCGDKEGVARCHPDDDFDFYIGAKIALERLEDAEKPYGWLKEGMRYYVPEILYRKLYDNYVYGADDGDKLYIERGVVFRTKEEAIACAKKILAAVKQEG